MTSYEFRGRAPFVDRGGAFIHTHEWWLPDESGYHSNFSPTDIASAARFGYTMLVVGKGGQIEVFSGGDLDSNTTKDVDKILADDPNATVVNLSDNSISKLQNLGVLKKCN